MATLQERQALADNLQRMREEKGLSQQELADAAGVSRNAVDQWENGSYIPNVIAAAAVAEKLGVTCEQLIATEGKEG